MVPQLNDNIRLTIEEYRNKLYQFIQNKPLVRLSNSAAAITAQYPTSEHQNNQQHQKPAKTATVNLQRSNTYHHNQQHHQQRQHQQAQYKTAESPELQSELVDHYAQQKIIYQSSYNQNYDSNNPSDDNQSTTSEGTTPPQYMAANRNQIVGNASAIVGTASASVGTNNNANINRKKHPSDFQNNNSNNFIGTNATSTNILGGIGSTSHTG